MTWTRSSKPYTDIGPIRALLATAVDHAGLFPPTGLNMSAAVAAFNSYRKGPHAWMLGSFVVSAARLDELVEAMAALAVDDAPWPVSILVDSLDQGTRAVEVARRFSSRLSATAIEVRPRAAAAVREGRPASRATLEGVAVFQEVPLDAETEARLDAVAHVGAHAKVRTGGVTEGAFPSGASIVRFAHACAERGLAFKATAGLHHAFRGTYALTYEPGSARAPMHGFLALSLVAGLIHAGAVDDEEASALLERSVEALEVDDAGVRWAGHRLTTSEIEDARARFFRSFGSCSFAEPVAELEAAGLIVER